VLEFYDCRYRAGEPLPIRTLAFELFSARARELVELGTPTELARPPLGLNPTLLLKFVQRGVQRSVADLKGTTRDLAQSLADRPPVHGFEREDLESQQVRRTKAGCPARVGGPSPARASGKQGLRDPQRFALVPRPLPGMSARARACSLGA
jgi:hypothetical protein